MASAQVLSPFYFLVVYSRSRWCCSTGNVVGSAEKSFFGISKPFPEAVRINLTTAPGKVFGTTCFMWGVQKGIKG